MRRSTAKIDSCLGKESTNIGTFRGFGTDRAMLCTLRRFGTEHEKLRTFRGSGTKRARLGTFNQNFDVFTQNEHIPTQKFFCLNFGCKSKNRPTYWDFEKKN